MINNGLVFKMKDGHELEVQTPESMKLFSSTNKLINKTNNGDNVEVVLLQRNLVDNQYQKKSQILCAIMPNKSYAYLLNIEPINLVFLKTKNTKFDEIIIIFTNQNGRRLEIDDKVNFELLINKTEDLNIIMPLYNLPEYNGNYFMKAGSVSNYYREQVDNVNCNS